jgi:hypothetical protein
VANLPQQLDSASHGPSPLAVGGVDREGEDAYDQSEGLKEVGQYMHNCAEVPHQSQSCVMPSTRLSVPDGANGDDDALSSVGDDMTCHGDAGSPSWSS